jgi:dGTPase
MNGRPDLSRVHANDPEAGLLAPLALDRQRILHSTAFRRLQYKTQVFVAPESDHFRTRLTHTLEVAHVARVLAGAIGANAELAEVVALAHDLGHPPFGHAGERALDECLREAGRKGRATGGDSVCGFEHNDQSLRVVEYLEHPFPGFRGLNLTAAVRQCLAKHQTRYDRPNTPHVSTGEWAEAAAPIESSVAAWADQIAYCLHDVQDGLFAEFFTVDDLRAVALWREHYSKVSAGGGNVRSMVRPTLERIQGTLIDDLRAGAGSRTRQNLHLSASLAEDYAALADFLRDRVYRHHQVVRSDAKARRLVRAVFEAYVDSPDLLPPRYRSRVEEQGAARVAADYIAGMTDRFCLEEHSRLFDPRGGF